MGLLLILLLFLFALSRVGRIGPFEWAGPVRRFGPPPWAYHGTFGPQGPAPEAGEDAGRVRPPFGPPADPERILARRLADGEISSDDYLERLSLIQSR
jgi:hypothetical protein